MKAPRFLLAAGLLFWGWQTHLLAFAVPMALAVEGARRVAWRWEFTDNEFNRLADLTNLLFVGTAIYLFSREGAHGVFVLVTWLPMVLFLLLAALVYSTRSDLSLATLFLSVRRIQARGALERVERVDLTYPYFAICLIAAAVANTDNPWFFPGALVLTGWALAAVRPRRYPLWLWTSLLLTAGGVGYAGQTGLQDLQGRLEQVFLAWFQDRLWNRRDPYRSTTAIGQIGHLKFSDSIILHVAPPPGKAPPALLRQASYQYYSFGTWNARQDAFVPVDRLAKAGSWQLQPSAAPIRQVLISGSVPGGEAVLALPGGAFRIDGLPVPSLRANPYGAVKMEEGPGFVAYRVGYSPTSRRDTRPEGADLDLPGGQAPMLHRLAAELGIASMAPRKAIATLAGFFDRHFRYSLYTHGPGRAAKPLSQFLLRDRSGHCEYFASATVLLLRAAGIPARYAVGYAVQEKSGFADTYLVRSRHAHSWALAYVDGAWTDVDLTPALWADSEEANAPWWEPGYDFLAWTSYLFQRWRWSDTREEYYPWYLWLVLPLGILLAWRLRNQRKVLRELGTGSGEVPPADRSGRDSPFYRLLAEVERRGLTCRPGETLRTWASRVHRAGLDNGAPAAGLENILALHYRYRFDPEGLPAAERTRLRQLVEAWLRAG